ncbi:Asp-tRNA(Asn)/Glu-tRNA(Gln) amidotransferase subunit GatB [Candidatus Poribacteria bacterium]|nr:Asp-tRNA(Asn)/Glu-tRNA(Gln) amidotransferase subunit GatB [Candidatus Poribacteria bacterium]
MDKYEIVIGLEIHAELSTESKLFCNCAYTFGSSANDCTCPICLGLPGTLPVINQRALDYAIRTGLAMNCEITSYSKFDRKNYFYPDLPKNYQISQYDLPLCQNGKVEFELNGETKTVALRRIHLEEDAGKSIHAEVTGDPTRSFMDFNRAGVPLMEIVSEPEIHSPEEAIAYCRAVKEILEYIEVSDCNMEEGSLRCEPNISLRPQGSQELGTRTEIKNKNSFQELIDAMEYEVKRQARILDSGGKVVQETLLFDAETGKTVAMRSKEEADDYRYFPEPDLVHVQIDDEWVKEIQPSLPELPAIRRRRFTEDYNLTSEQVEFLTSTRQIADFFDEGTKLSGNPSICANWIMGDISRLLNNAEIEIQDSKLLPTHLSELIQLIEDNTISGKIAKSVIDEAFQSGKLPKQIVDEEGLSQISDTSELEAIVQKVIEDNPGPAQDVRDGTKKAIGFLVGQVMRATQGKANPQAVNQILSKVLSEE